MTAFDSSKNKFMPTDYTTLDTPDLLDVIAAGPLTAPQAAALSEMQTYRIIRENDKDDIVTGGQPQTRKGVRPKHVPIVP